MTIMTQMLTQYLKSLSRFVLYEDNDTDAHTMLEELEQVMNKPSSNLNMKLLKLNSNI